MIKRSVLFISEFYPPTVHGGGEISCQMLAQNLAKAGMAITVLTNRVPGLPAEQTEKGVRILRKLSTGKPNRLSSAFARVVLFQRSLLRETRKLIDAGEFSTVHCFNMTSIPAITLRREAGIPFLAHVNSLTFACPKGDLLYHGKSLCNIRCDYTTFVPCLRDCSEIGKLKNTPLISYNPIALSTIYARYFNQKRLLRKFDQVVAISGFLKERLIRIGVSRKKISVLHNIINLTKFKGGATHATVPRLLFLGTLSAAKGVPELLAALEGLPGKWRCDIYGDGPMRNAVMQQARQDASPHSGL